LRGGVGGGGGGWGGGAGAPPPPPHPPHPPTPNPQSPLFYFVCIYVQKNLNKKNIYLTKKFDYKWLQ